MDIKSAEVARLAERVEAAKGRYHTQLAACDLLDYLGMQCTRPGEASLQDEAEAKLASLVSIILRPMMKNCQGDDLLGEATKIALSPPHACLARRDARVVAAAMQELYHQWSGHCVVRKGALLDYAAEVQKEADEAQQQAEGGDV